MVERKQIHQRPHMDLARAHRERGEENIRRGAHPERRRMMLGEVIAEDARAIRDLEQLQAFLVELLQRNIATLHVIENSECDLHAAPPQTVIPNSDCALPARACTTVAA